MARFEDQVDPGRELSPQERARRADSAPTAHFLKLARRSIDARRPKTEASRLRPLADELENLGLERLAVASGASGRDQLERRQEEVQEAAPD